MRRAAPFLCVCALAALVPACHETTTEVVYVTGLLVTPADTAIRQGGSLQLRASLVDTAGHPVLDVPAAFASSDSSVARVSASGFLTTRGPLGGVIVTASYSRFEAAAFVRVFDSTLSASLELSARPFGVAVSAQNIVYVTRLDAAALARIDLPTAGFSGSVAAGSIPTDVAFTHDGKTAYVADQFSDNVGVVDVRRDMQVDVIPVIGDPFDVIVAPDDQTIFVSTNVDTVYRINPVAKTVVAKFGLPTVFGVVLTGLTFNRDGTLLYASTRAAGTVIEYSVTENVVLRTIPVGGQPQGVAVSPDGTELYVADETGSQLLVWDLTANALTASVPLGGSPFDLKLTPDDAQIYVGIRTSGQVQVFDRVTRALARTIPTQGMPRRIAFAASGMAVVANEAGWVDLVK